MKSLTMLHRPWAVSSWLSWWREFLISLNVMDQTFPQKGKTNQIIKHGQHKPVFQTVFYMHSICEHSFYCTSVHCIELNLMALWIWILLVGFTISPHPLHQKDAGRCERSSCCTVWMHYYIEADPTWHGQFVLASATRRCLRQHTVLVCCCPLLQPWRPDIFINLRVTALDQSGFLSLLSLMQCAPYWVRQVQPVQPQRLTLENLESPKTFEGGAIS